MTLNVPDTAERKHKEDGLRRLQSSSSTYTWLILFLCLSILVALLLISLLILRYSTFNVEVSKVDKLESAVPIKSQPDFTAKSATDKGKELGI